MSKEMTPDPCGAVLDKQTWRWAGELIESSVTDGVGSERFLDTLRLAQADGYGVSVAAPLTTVLASLVNAQPGVMSPAELVAHVWRIVDAFPERVTPDAITSMSAALLDEETVLDDADEPQVGIEEPSATPRWAIDHLVGDVLEAFMDAGRSPSGRFFEVIDEMRYNRQLRDSLLSMAVSWFSLIGYCEKHDLGPTYASQLDLIRMSSPDDYLDD